MCSNDGQLGRVNYAARGLECGPRLGNVTRVPIFNDLHPVHPRSRVSDDENNVLRPPGVLGAKI